jgi:hypothetical protein
MVVTILDTDITIAEVCGIQAHNMNTLADAGSTRIFSDDQISYTINNVIRFVRANSRSDIEDNAKINAINTLSVIALNNIMKEAGYLPEWDIQDPFDKLKFIEMITTIKEDEDDIDVIPLYRNQRNEVY